MRGACAHDVPVAVLRRPRAVDVRDEIDVLLRIVLHRLGPLESANDANEPRLGDGNSYRHSASRARAHAGGNLFGEALALCALRDRTALVLRSACARQSN